MGIEAVDTLLWQGLASVAIPGLTINLIVRTAGKAVRGNPRERAAAAHRTQDSLSWPAAVELGPLARAGLRFLPTMCGLGSIPFIVHPIDTFVDFVLDNSYRPYFRNVERNVD